MKTITKLATVAVLVLGVQSAFAQTDTAYNNRRNTNPTYNNGGTTPNNNNTNPRTGTGNTDKKK